MDAADSSDEYHENRPRKKARRIKRNGPVTAVVLDPIQPLNDLIESYFSLEDDESEPCFDDEIQDMLPEFMLARDRAMASMAECGENGVLLRPMTYLEASTITNTYDALKVDLTSAERLALRKLKLHKSSIKSLTRDNAFVTPIPDTTIPKAPAKVLDTLEDIRTTPFDHSFLSRLHGSTQKSSGVFSLDWEPNTPWILLMKDVREHFRLRCPEECADSYEEACLMYTYLQEHHISSVNALLQDTFWDGIDIRDCLDYSPERCTVVAVYKCLVVGVALMSSPRETYITYTAVRHGWENAHIASTMIYHLVRLSPGKDITLHVSANSPAMLLYNRLGFKTERFVVGFYEEYLRKDSKASKNAFLLRLRQQ